MIFVKDKIKELVAQAVKAKFPSEKLEIKIEYPTAAAHGDYACAIALELVKKVGKAPKLIAEEIITAIKKPNWIKEITIAGPGFINFFLAPEFLSEFLEEIKKQGGEFGIGEENSKRTVVIDFSQPNIAKPLGIHHLLSTIIGQSLYNIHKFLGFKTVGINHIGDWGTQFGKLSYAYRKWGDQKTVEANPIAELLKLYVKFHEEAEKDPALEENGRAEFKKLEQGDAENTKLWRWFCEVSMEEVQKTYDYLGGIHFDYTQGESFYEDKMAPILERGKAEKIFVTGKEGSWVVQFKDDKYPPYLVQKSDGATLYSTRDLAAIDYREKTWHPEKILYVVDVAQSLHFQQLFETAKLLNLAKAELTHVVFGRMQFKDKKMSTRKGNIVLLDEVLKESVAKARTIVEEKNPDLSEEKKAEVAHQVGVGAVKYAALSQNRTTNIIFDWDKMLSLEGNSAPYLQYVHARACSILRKAKEAGAGEGKQAKYILKEPQELNLARLLPKFPEVVLLAAQEFKPNLITTYLFELASSFNGFYAAVPILKGEADAIEVRLKLVEATILTLKNGLKLLGIEAPEEM
ncbi:MAG: arginine--tRNA ligase [Candidatus Gracilibacteria bacterium]